MITTCKDFSVKNKGIALNDILVRIKPVVSEVKTFGDSAVIKYTKLYDGFNLSKNTMKVSPKEIKEAYAKTDAKVVRALLDAAKNIRSYAQKQMPKSWMTTIRKGVTVGQQVIPLDRVGCYVPAGAYPLPSTVLMTVIPAKVAGVREIVLCSPPKPGNYAILVAADIAGASAIYKVGGAQAIAAMAYGTQTIPKVDKIVGPGNIYVTAAKKLVYGDVGVDFIAGPTEIMIFAGRGDPAMIAADMLAQAEHDRMASAILVTTNRKLASSVEAELQKQLRKLPTKDIAAESIRKNSAIVIAQNVDEAFDFINERAPEHLELMEERYLSKVKNAGAIFVGRYSCEAAGDYAAGPSHVLPTLGAARYRAGLSVLDFVKMPSVQKLTKGGLAGLKKTICVIARAEGLEAHARSVESR
ncbi:MAG TPA: histidinol dehydrogenase [Candidatus Nanoarchaeia archaeon]|nr:histidinol dehydrogenase [Candidatus Nanoarchaeia archaeon]